MYDWTDLIFDSADYFRCWSCSRSRSHVGSSSFLGVYFSSRFRTHEKRMREPEVRRPGGHTEPLEKKKEIKRQRRLLLDGRKSKSTLGRQPLYVLPNAIHRRPAIYKLLSEV